MNVDATQGPVLFYPWETAFKEDTPPDEPILPTPVGLLANLQAVMHDAIRLGAYRDERKRRIDVCFNRVREIFSEYHLPDVYRDWQRENFNPKSMKALYVKMAIAIVRANTREISRLSLSPTVS